MNEQKQEFNSECYDQQFTVSCSYPVYFCHDLFNPANPLLGDAVSALDSHGPHRVLTYIDDGLLKVNPQLEKRVMFYLNSRPESFDLVHEPEVVPGGERTKNGWNVVQNIMVTAGNQHLCRHSLILIVGGGSVQDMVGFAASLVHRGIRVIRVPTTVLSQCDGGVGVKTGMDEHGMKNFIGTFSPPFAVLNDFDFLQTLENKYWIGGIAEAFKVAIIKDADFLEFLCGAADKLCARDESLIEEVVRRTAILHLDHIRTSGDAFEGGSARPLDFGHWAAHRLEVASSYRYGHGQAVSLGIALDTCYAAEKGLIAKDERLRILDGLYRTGLPVWTPLLAQRTGRESLAILKGLEEFREHLGGRLTITLPDGIGRKIEVHNVDVAAVETAIQFLQQWAEQLVPVAERGPA